MPPVLQINLNHHHHHNGVTFHNHIYHLSNKDVSKEVSLVPVQSTPNGQIPTAPPLQTSPPHTLINQPHNPDQFQSQVSKLLHCIF